MAWIIEFTKQSAKQFNKLDKAIQQRIIKFLNNRLGLLADPRIIGKPLQGVLSEYWSYRIGDYRLLAKIQDQRLLIVLTDIAHRRHIYK